MFGALRDDRVKMQWQRLCVAHARCRNHREAIAAIDFFTVPTLTFGVLYCFFVIGCDRRKILHFNVTRNPTALWVVQ